MKYSQLLRGSGIVLPDNRLINDKDHKFVHDPSVIKHDGVYYMYSTDVGEPDGIYRPGIHVRRSADLINWEWCGRALEDIPASAKAHVRKPGGIWAPDISYIDSTFYLVYCVSIFGTNNSYIGAAKSNSPLGPWQDLGEIITTDDGDAPNALDPNLITDRHGRLFMCYGSFFGGIYICELDKSTLKRKDTSSFGTKIAQRNEKAHYGGIEGPYIVYNEKFDKYYLFSSYDDLAKTYNIRVARADEVTGPYYDFNGICMTDTEYTPYDRVGLKITNGYKFADETAWIGPGHNSVLKDGDDWYVISHARDTSRKNTPYVHVRKMLWTDEGFPVVSPEQYMGEITQAVPRRLILGEWDVIVLSCDTNEVIRSQRVTLSESGTALSGTVWKYENDTLTLTFGAAVYSCRVLPGYNRDKSAPTIVFTGIGDNGFCIWGKHITDE